MLRPLHASKNVYNIYCKRHHTKGGIEIVSSRCRDCVWYEQCSAYGNLLDQYRESTGAFTDLTSDDIDTPWCLTPYTPEELYLVEVDGRWYTEPQAHAIYIRELLDGGIL